MMVDIGNALPAYKEFGKFAIKVTESMLLSFLLYPKLSEKVNQRCKRMF